MSTDQPHAPQFAAGSPPPRSGSKTLLIVLIVFGVLILLCCGGIAVIGLLTASWAGDMVSQDPVKIAATQDLMVEMAVPEELRPEMTLDMKVPFTGQRIMTWVAYTDKPTNSMLLLVGLGEMMAGQNPDQVRLQIEQSLQQQGQSGSEKTVAEETYEHEVEIGGETVAFTITKGTGDKSGNPRIQAVGAFEGKSGTVMLMLDADAETLPEERVIEILDSIKK